MGRKISGNIQIFYGWDGEIPKNNPDPSIFKVLPVKWTEMPKSNPIPVAGSAYSFHLLVYANSLCCQLLLQPGYSLSPLPPPPPGAADDSDTVTLPAP